MADYILQGQVRDSTGNLTTSAVTVTVAAIPTGMPTFGHVFVIVEENRDYSEVVGHMPYLESLAAKYGLATQYYADTHPSIGNYFMMTCGQIISNDDSFSTIVTADNIIRHINAAGKTWKDYAESIPSVGYLGGDTGLYARKHNTIVLYSDVANDPVQAQKVVPFTQFAVDLAAGTLPNYSFIVPNLISDAHDGTLAQADAWLQTNIDPLIKSSLFQQDGVLFIIFDEGSSDSTNGGGKVYSVVISSKVIPGVQSSAFHNHESLLRTCMEAMGMTSFPGAAATAADMSEFFTGTVPPPPPPPPVVASVVISPSTINVSTGQTVQLSALAKDASGNTISGQTFTWVSSNTSVATVNNNGLVSILTVGSATITATTSGITGSCAITAVVPTAGKFTIGQSVKVTQNAYIRSDPFHGNTTINVLGTAPANSIGIIVGGPVLDNSSDGDGWIRWNVTFTSPPSGWVAENYLVANTAVPPPPPPTPVVTTVNVLPSSASIVVGTTAKFNAQALDQSGAVMPGQSFAWSSSNPIVAPVDTTGLATGLTAGTSVIGATDAGKTGSANLIVTTTPPPPPPPPSSAKWTVDPVNGSDSNLGISTSPFRTISKALSVAAPGDLIAVLPGVISGTDPVLSVNRGGTVGNPITIRSLTTWGAILDGNNNTSAEAVNFGASNVRVEGFEIRNCWHDAVEASAGGLSNIAIARCHIHHIGKQCSDGSEGRSGIDAYSNSLTIEGNLIHDIGRFGPGEDPSCTPSSTAWQNHDHGVYLGQGAGVIIRNNIFIACDRGWAIQRFGGGFPVDNCLIANNTFAYPNPNKVGHIIVAGNFSNSIFANNIFYKPNTAGIWWDGGALSNVQVINNLSTGPLSTGSSSGATFSNNIENVDPMFIDPVNGDFHLKVGSPAIGAGATLIGVLDNFDGVLRIGAYNIGAY